tara:strand:+ start:2261 stop:3115 length:855 start_codon:yes stop_codon:yes gene_type:complete
MKSNNNKCKNIDLGWFLLNPSICLAYNVKKMIYEKRKFYIFFIFAYFLVFESLLAEKIYFNLSEEIIEVKTDFSGKEIIIFGITETAYDTILVLKGPNKKANLSIKERLFGFWIKTKNFSYQNIPNIFFIASSSPIEKILEDKIIREKGLTFKYFNINEINKQNETNTKLFENNLYEWDRNLIRKQKENDLYKEYELEIIDDKLFQARFFFPPTVVTGEYKIKVFQVLNKKIISEDDKKIIIKKTGIGNQISNFAINQPLIYGIICIALSVGLGIFAATVFRRF